VTAEPPSGDGVYEFQGGSPRKAARFVMAAALCWALCAKGFGQQERFDALPDAPTPAQQAQAGQTQAGQTTTDQPQTQPERGANPVTNGVSVGVGKFLELQQKSLVFPDLATTHGPLTPWDKLKLGANNTVSLSSVSAAVIGSAYGQAVNSPSGWGQGWGAYGQRLGADMARIASYNFFGTFAIASMTHEDPRFYVREGLNFGDSLKYAASRLVITRSDTGEDGVNYAGILGPLAAEGLANAYYPSSSRGIGHTMIRYSTDVGWRFAGYVLRQYWPEINRRLGTREEVDVAKP
jgi:hypothetical protein